jgi:hypothetical protein
MGCKVSWYVSVPIICVVPCLIFQTPLGYGQTPLQVLRPYATGHIISLLYADTIMYVVPYLCHLDDV